VQLFSHRHSKSVFIIGRDTTIKNNQFDIIRWNPQAGDEFLIGCFPFCPDALVAAIEGGFVRILVAFSFS